MIIKGSSWPGKGDSRSFLFSDNYIPIGICGHLDILR